MSFSPHNKEVLFPTLMGFQIDIDILVNQN